MPSSLLQAKTPDNWVQNVLDNFNDFLLDHAACERKAASLAMSFVVKYPDRKLLIEPMVSLALEELKHYKEVYKIIADEDLDLPHKDEKDIYVNHLLTKIRHGRDERLLDRLLMSSLIEARGEERFTLVANAVKDPFFKEFYQRLANEEAGHHMIFLKLAHHYFSEEQINKRVQELAIFEAEAMKAAPLTHRLH